MVFPQVLGPCNRPENSGVISYGWDGEKGKKFHLVNWSFMSSPRRLGAWVFKICLIIGELCWVASLGGLRRKEIDSGSV